MIHEISFDVDEWQSIIGKSLRKRDMSFLGTIVKVFSENDAHWGNDKLWIETDKGEKVLVNKVGKISETSVILEVY